MALMRYELFMSAALSEAGRAKSEGERPRGAVAVLDEAMVAAEHERVRASGDPTAHAVMVTVREAARRLRRTSLTGVTVFSVVEPCRMCLGALAASNVDGLVFAIPDPTEKRTPARTAAAIPPGGLAVVSGILQADARELVGTAPSGRR
jgi:tRNA(adenine34) deaminase